MRVVRVTQIQFAEIGAVPATGICVSAWGLAFSFQTGLPVAGESLVPDFFHRVTAKAPAIALSGGKRTGSNIQLLVDIHREESALAGVDILGGDPSAIEQKRHKTGVKADGHATLIVVDQLQKVIKGGATF